MNIKVLEIHLISDKPRLKAVASIIINEELIINDIRVIQGAKRLLIDFPRHPYALRHPGMEVIVPATSAVRYQMEQAILTVYRVKQEESGNG